VNLACKTSRMCYTADSVGIREKNMTNSRSRRNLVCLPTFGNRLTLNCRFLHDIQFPVYSQFINSNTVYYLSYCHFECIQSYLTVVWYE